MNAQTKPETLIRQRITQRLTEWWGEDDPVAVAAAVDELMTDLGYTIKRVSVRKADPAGYKRTQREYMRAYQRQRRAKLKETANG